MFDADKLYEYIAYCIEDTLPDIIEEVSDVVEGYDPDWCLPSKAYDSTIKGMEKKAITALADAIYSRMLYYNFDV